MPQNFERGLRLATREFVTTLGDDDLIVEEDLNLALDSMHEHACDLVHWTRMYFYWWSSPDESFAGAFAIPIVTSVGVKGTAVSGVFRTPGAISVTKQELSRDGEAKS